MPGSDAAGSFVEDFARAVSNYVRTTVVAPGHVAAREQRNGYTVHRFKAPARPLSLLKLGRPADWRIIARTLAAGSKAVADAVESERPSHVVALWALPSGYWARQVSRTRNVPYSVWALGSDIWSLGRLPIVRGTLKQVLGDAAHRFADGLQLANDVEALSSARCEFLPSARQLEITCRIAPSTAPPYRLAYLGRWHRNKGVDLLLEALGMLDVSDWARIAEVRVAGGGPMAASVERHVRVLQSRGRPISLHGYLSKPEAAALLHWADFLLIPSRIESIPVVLSDAMQCGCAVIACPVGDLPLIVSRYQIGVLASTVNAPGIKQAISAALNAAPSDFQRGLNTARADFDVETSARRLLQRVGMLTS